MLFALSNWAIGMRHLTRIGYRIARRQTNQLLASFAWAVPGMMWTLPDHDAECDCPMTAPFLALPSTDYKRSFINAVHEFIEEGRWQGWKPYLLEAEFDSYVENVRLLETEPPRGFVPQTTFWLIVDGEYAGRASVRHWLNESLEQFGGHIGYEVRPSMRRKGYGTLMCALAIVEARKLGIGRILITCDDTNIGSQKIIEANGGVLQDTVDVDNGRPGLTRRYWIETPE